MQRLKVPQLNISGTKEGNHPSASQCGNIGPHQSPFSHVTTWLICIQNSLPLLPLAFKFQLDFSRAALPYCKKPREGGVGGGRKGRISVARREKSSNEILNIHKATCIMNCGGGKLNSFGTFDWNWHWWEAHYLLSFSVQVELRLKTTWLRILKPPLHPWKLDDGDSRAQWAQWGIIWTLIRIRGPLRLVGWDSLIGGFLERMIAIRSVDDGCWIERDSGAAICQLWRPISPPKEYRWLKTRRISAIWIDSFSIKISHWFINGRNRSPFISFHLIAVRHWNAIAVFMVIFFLFFGFVIEFNDGGMDHDRSTRLSIVKSGAKRWWNSYL